MTDENQTEENTSTFAIVITPEFKENGEWSGDISTHMEEDVRGDLKDDDLMQIRSVCGMMASTLTLMEHDEDFLDYVRDFFLQNYQSMIEEFIADGKESPSFTRSSDGNVITLDFNTKTHGSA